MIIYISVLILGGCAIERKQNSISSHTCIECGNKASNYAGTKWNSKDYSEVGLYYCDSCYNKIEEKENYVFVNDIWW